MRRSRRSHPRAHTGARSGWNAPATILARLLGRCWPRGSCHGLGSGRRFTLAAIPGVFSAFVITVAAREARRRRTVRTRRQRLRQQFTRIRSSGLLPALFPIAAFDLGNMATTLLILRGTGLLRSDGYTVAEATSLAVLIYAAHNLFAAIVAFLAGHWIDRHGPRLAFATGAALYAASYALFAISGHGWVTLVPAFLLAGSGIGLAETAESALVASVLPDELRGSGFGLVGGIEALDDFASSTIVGLLWAVVSPAAGFLYAAGWMAVSLAGSATILSPT